MMEPRGSVLTGLGLGASLMYFLDPERGRRRRALVRDRLIHASTLAGNAAGATGRDVANRASGAVARVRGVLRHPAVDDVVLVERVRAQLGHLVSHPRALDVSAADGAVTLSGPILQAEVPRLLGAVGRIGGVRHVVNAMDEHAEAGDVPALQGGAAPHLQSETPRREPSPAMRIVTGTTGLGLAGYGASRRDTPGLLMATAGLGLLARAAMTRTRNRALHGTSGTHETTGTRAETTPDNAASPGVH